MAERGELPRVFGRVHSRFRTPHVAIFAYALLALGLALYGSFTWNATRSASVRLLTFGLTCVALLVFRRRKDVGEPGFRVPAAAVVAPLAAGFCLWLLATRTLTQAWITAALVAAGALLFLLRRRA
jgi:APA family basic amino acid/polyamine antiporter